MIALANRSVSKQQQASIYQYFLVTQDKYKDISISNKKNYIWWFLLAGKDNKIIAYDMHCLLRNLYADIWTTN